MRNLHAISLLLATLFTGMAYAFLFPLTSLYLVNELGASPVMMGLFMSVMMLSGVLVSNELAKRSDRGLSRKRLVLAGQVGFILMILTLIFTRQYFVALAAAILFMSVSSCSLPQLFTLGRLYADQHLGSKASFYVSLMRAAIAVAWVIGPPMAFVLHAHFGFTGAFVAALSAAVLVLIIVLPLTEFRPALSDDFETTPAAQTTIAWRKDVAIVRFLLATIAMFAAVNMYLIAMPLHLTTNLAISSQWVGNLMGLAAFIEVPIMVLAGLYGSRLGLRNLMIVGVLAGAIFFAGFMVFESIIGLLILQLFNGLFVGITASVGIVLVQDLMKHSIGLATTLFNNAQQLAMLLGNFGAGLIAQWLGYANVFVFCAVFALVAAFLLMLMNRPVRPVPSPVH